jgi:hypothetical protein
MTAGSGSYSKRRTGRVRFVLFSTLVIFGGGFYTGVYATKRVIASDSGIMHRIFGVQSPLPPPAVTPALPAAVTPSAAPPPAATQPATPPPATVPPATTTPPVKPESATAAPRSNGGPSDASTSSNTGQNTPAEEHKSETPDTRSTEAGDTGSDQSLLAKQVEDYNDMLHRIQDALRRYSVIHQKQLDPKTKTQDLKALTDQETTLFAEISRNAKHAQNLQDAIRDNTSYAAQYMEGGNCTARKDVPTRLLDLDLDKLKFIDKAP